MNISYGYYHRYKIKSPFRYVIRLELLLAFFLSILYSTCVEKGVCFRTALEESLCGSFLCMGFSLYGHLMPGDIHRKELKKELKLFEFLFEFVK